MVLFLDRTFILSKNIDIFRNLNHYQIYNDEKEKFQTIADIKLRHILKF